MCEKERNTIRNQATSNGRPYRRAHIAIHTVPEQLVARLPCEFTLCVRVLGSLHFFDERIKFATSFAGRFTGYTRGQGGKGYVGRESRISSGDEMGAKSVDAMSVGMKDRGSMSRQCRRLYSV